MHIVTKQGPAVGCPREPWHDLHSKIDGPAAYDVLTNFEERWLKASKRHGLRKMGASHDDSLLRLERIPDILGIAEAASQREDDPEGWHVQVWRKEKQFRLSNFFFFIGPNLLDCVGLSFN